MSEQLPVVSGGSGDNDTMVVYYVDGEDLPYLVSVHASPDTITLGDFKNVLKLNRPLKYFFKTPDTTVKMGYVKKEITDDKCQLPVGEEGRVIAWLNTVENSEISAEGSKAMARPHHNGFGGTRYPIQLGLADVQSEQVRDYQQRIMANFDRTYATSDDESLLSGLPATKDPKLAIKGKKDLRLLQPQHYQSRAHRRVNEDSTLISDSDNRHDSDDDKSGISSSDITSVSRQFDKMQRKRRRPRVKRPRQAASRVSSITSITESSMSLNIITVVLNMDQVNFLGISIVGQTSQRGDGGIFVANIMKGGAVALDGRIETGDMILQVNSTPFENLTNDEAVAVLRKAVQNKGPIKLIVAKCWEPRHNCFTVPRHEPARPIDPAAWVQHTNAIRAGMSVMPSILEGSEGAPTPIPGNGGYQRPDSAGTSHNSGSAVGGQKIHDVNAAGQELMLTSDMGMDFVTRAIATSGTLEIKDRTWLKITIPNAFLGSELVTWLHEKVGGLIDKKDARKFAAEMLKHGFIKHTVNKTTFTEQCYYVFGDGICNNMAALNLGSSVGTQGAGQVGDLQNYQYQGPMHNLETGSGIIRDDRWAPPATTSCRSSDHGDTLIPPMPTPQFDYYGHQPTAPSLVSGYASMPMQFGSGDTAGPVHMGSLPIATAVDSNRPRHHGSGSINDVGRAGSAGGAGAGSAHSQSSGSEKRRTDKAAIGTQQPSGKNVPILGPSVPPKPSILSNPNKVVFTGSTQQECDNGVNQEQTPSRSLMQVPQNLACSRASFRLAMGNPCDSEFFIDNI